MTGAAQPGSDDVLGPVDFLAIEFPGGQLTAAGFERLLALANDGGPPLACSTTPT
jgi:hypothetical protein